MRLVPEYNAAEERLLKQAQQARNRLKRAAGDLDKLAVKMADAGFPITTVAEATGISTSTLYRMGVTRNNARKEG